MKFLCRNCKAKYQIADEKVAGRTMRMTCQQCGEPIVVRGHPLGPRPGPPPLPPRDFQDQWHVAINDSPVGPLSLAEVTRRLAQGSIDQESLVWREGMEDWNHLRNVEAFKPPSASNGATPPIASPGSQSSAPHTTPDLRVSELPESSPIVEEILFNIDAPALPVGVAENLRQALTMKEAWRRARALANTVLVPTPRLRLFAAIALISSGLAISATKERAPNSAAPSLVLTRPQDGEWVAMSSTEIKPEHIRSVLRESPIDSDDVQDDAQFERYANALSKLDGLSGCYMQDATVPEWSSCNGYKIGRISSPKEGSLESLKPLISPPRYLMRRAKTEELAWLAKLDPGNARTPSPALRELGRGSERTTTAPTK